MKYHNSKTPNKKVIDRLSKNNNIIVIKQDKGRRLVILDRTKYTGWAKKDVSKTETFLWFGKIMTNYWLIITGISIINSIATQ